MNAAKGSGDASNRFDLSVQFDVDPVPTFQTAISTHPATCRWHVYPLRTWAFPFNDCNDPIRVRTETINEAAGPTDLKFGARRFA